MEKPVIRVRALGGLSLACGTTECAYDNRAYKTWLLIAYLIFNRGRMVPRKELLSLLAGGSAYADSNQVLRNHRFQARRLLEPLSAAVGLELVVTSGSFCGWNPSVETEVDAERFERLCAAIPKETPEARLARLREAMALFGGELLEPFSSEPWVAYLAATCLARYRDGVEELLPLLEGEEAFAEEAELCRAAAQIFPYDESIHRGLMRALFHQGDAAEAGAIYKSLRDRLAREMDIVPEPETQELFREILRQTGTAQAAPEEIIRRLREGAAPEGVIIYDFPEFRLLYQAEARSAHRRGYAVHIGVLSIYARNGEPLSERKLARAMEQLQIQLRRTLRVGDAAVCYSASQCLVMLAQADYESAQTVCDRVSRAFAAAYPQSPAQIRGSVLPMEPLLPEDLPRKTVQFR